MKKNYISPVVEIVSVNIERGFAESLDSGIYDYVWSDKDSTDE